MRRGGRAPPHPHQPGLILPSSLNVRQKAAVATLCTLWERQLTGNEEDKQKAVISVLYYKTSREYREKPE
jgi:hypothetical protein